MNDDLVHPKGAGGDVLGQLLADGVLTCELASYAWDELDLTSFLFTDVERDQDLFSVSESFTFTQ